MVPGVSQVTLDHIHTAWLFEDEELLRRCADPTYVPTVPVEHAARTVEEDGPVLPLSGIAPPVRVRV